MSCPAADVHVQEDLKPDGDLRGWLEAQFARHASLVRAAIWNRLGRVRDSHLVEELAAETWSRAVAGVKKPGFNATLEFAPWVCGIAANVCREHFRRMARQSHPDLSLDAEDPTAAVEFRRAQELLELHRAIAECLSRLGEEERRVYQLRFEQGLSGRSTATALGVPESTFREKHLSSLLRGLARCLSAKGFSELFPRLVGSREASDAHPGREGQTP